MGSIAAMQSAAVLIDRANIGYDQSQRWTFFNRSTKKVASLGEADCSSTCGAIMLLGGYKVDLSGTFYTGNFAEKAKAAGFTVLRFTSLQDVQAGDFLVTPGKHVEFAYSKDRFFSAHIDERGRAVGGQIGDQTGREVSFGGAYVLRGGWTYIVRPPKETVVKKVTSTVKKVVTSSKPAPVLSVGSSGSAVKDLQRTLNAKYPAYSRLKVDGVFGPGTKAVVMEFQRRAGLTVDGIVGAKTRAALGL